LSVNLCKIPATVLIARFSIELLVKLSRLPSAYTCMWINVTTTTDSRKKQGWFDSDVSGIVADAFSDQLPY
jgi:hypothetical protein